MASSCRYHKYTGCKAKRRGVQWDPQRVQLHPLLPPGYGPVYLTMYVTVQKPGVHRMSCLCHLLPCIKYGNNTYKYDESVWWRVGETRMEGKVS